MVGRGGGVVVAVAVAVCVGGEFKHSLNKYAFQSKPMCAIDFSL
jgi:hypothetical protein